MVKILDKRTPSPEELSKKFNKPLKYIKKQIEVGEKIEREHTSNDKVANEIARDHVAEKPDYYDKLKKAKLEELNKEDNLSEVLGPDTGVDEYIHDFVHSKNKRFAGHSKKKRIKQALAAYYKNKRMDEAKGYYNATRPTLKNLYIGKGSKENPNPVNPGKPKGEAMKRAFDSINKAFAPGSIKKEETHLFERNKENHKKVKEWLPKHRDKEHVNEFDPRRMLSPHNRKKVHKMLVQKINEVDVASIAKHVAKDYVAHKTVNAGETAAHSAVGGGYEHGHETGKFSNPKLKDLAKGAAEFAIPGSVKAYHQAKKGEYGKAASTFGTGVVKTGLSLATKGVSDVMTPAAASAGENEFKRQEKMTKEETQLNELSKKTLGRYLHKAVGDYGNRRAHGALGVEDEYYEKTDKRKKYINKAIKKVTRESLEDLLEQNYIGMKEKISEALGEKAIIALDERKKVIAAQYFGQSE